MRISDATLLRAYVRYLKELPYDSGNLRHNATTAQLGHPETRFITSSTEADYLGYVYEHYDRNGDNFLVRGALAVAEQLTFELNGGNYNANSDYQKARQSVYNDSISSVEREERNLLHGTGNFAKNNRAEAIKNIGKREVRRARRMGYR